MESNSIKNINLQILDLGTADARQISDGCFKFEELYEFKKLYIALLFNEWSKQNKYQVHKSKRDFVGNECGSCFVVFAMTPLGQIFIVCEEKDWDLFQVKETETALFKYDFNKTENNLKMLYNLIQYENSKRIPYF